MESNKVKIGIDGANGRMGQAIVDLLEQGESSNNVLTALFARKVMTHQKYYQSVQAGADKLDVLIDFTSPDNTLNNLKVCQLHGTAMVIGTTGLSPEQEEQIANAAQTIPVVYSANMSIGVNMLLSILEQTAKVLHNTFDIEVIEAHHKRKKDAPSGTALAIGKSIAKGMGCSLEERASYSRHGNDCEREPGSIGFSVIRAGDIIGEHTALFASEFERLEISHKASSRSVFAQGALAAASFVVHQSPGLYSMKDVLAL